MNISDFTYLLNEPANINPEQTILIEGIIKEFPYFQSARAIFLKGLKNQDSFRYNNELKNTAAHTTDRRILFEFISSSTFNAPINKSKTLDDLKVADIPVKNYQEILTTIEHPKQQPQQTVSDNIIANTTAIEPELTHHIAATHNQEKELAEKELELDKPLEFNVNEKHSFNEWMQLTKFKPIERDSPKESIPEKKVKTVKKTAEPIPAAAPTNESLVKKIKLIDAFIKNNPKISPVKDVSHPINLASTSIVEPNELMTETLARVYLAQKKYKKAMQAYKILILKNPEKSSFFADQIRAIKKLQKNK
jgi:tetratricopeptide (TPR) repeat protein